MERLGHAGHEEVIGTRGEAPGEEADPVLVVGFRNSSNSIRVVEVALDAGAPAAHLVDSAGGIDETWLQGVSAAGLTSGASVPGVLVDGVLQWLADHGHTDVETVRTADESSTFALPRELRRDLRADGRPRTPTNAAERRDP